MKNILWLAPYPYQFAQGISNGKSHPAPWITELAHEISKKTNLTIVNYSELVKGNVNVFESNGIRFEFVRSPRFRYDAMTFYRLRLRRLFNHMSKTSKKYDLIHVHGTEHQYEALAQKLERPYGISMQGIVNLIRRCYPTKVKPIPLRGLLYLRILLSSYYERVGIKHSRFFFCKTHVDSMFVRSLNPKARIFFCWEVIRKDFFKDLYDPYSKNLVFMGGTSPIKGLREALQCLDTLNREGYGFSLQICGKGSWRDIDKLATTDNLRVSDSDVNLLGLLPASGIAELFRKSFCLLHPSYMDNSPNSVCEAQVAGLPVIASNVGGVSSLVEDGKTGLLVNSHDYKSLSLNVKKLINNKELYERISRNSRITARKRHDREKIVSQTLEAYSAIIAPQSM